MPQQENGVHCACALHTHTRTPPTPPSQLEQRENGLHCACALHTHTPAHPDTPPSQPERHENGLHCACALHTHPHTPTQRRRSPNHTPMKCIALARCTHIPWRPAEAHLTADPNGRSTPAT